MSSRRPPRRSTALDEWERPTRQSYPLRPRSGPRANGRGNGGNNKTLILGALAALLVVVVVGSIALVLRDLQAQAPRTTSAPTSTIPAATAANTTPTPDRRDPVNNGWTLVTQAKFGDIQFAPSSSQHGYLCGVTPDGQTRIFGTTSNGGQKWETGTSPAAYPTCTIHISPTNSQDVALTSINAPGDGNSAYVDAHYSTDGGKTWKAAPFAQNMLGPADMAWSGSSLYAWSGANKGNGQQGFLKVRVNGGAFTSIDESKLLSGAQSVLIESAVASATKVYLNISYNGCASQNCEAIVASGDGGQTWTRIPNQSAIFVSAIVGSTLFGVSTQDVPFVTAVYTSADNGATWKSITLPPLSGSHGISNVVIAPDQTIFVSTTAGVSYLQSGAWTTFKVSSSDTDSIQVSEVSLGSNGRPQSVWGHDDSTHAGIYVHALP